MSYFSEDSAPDIDDLAYGEDPRKPRVIISDGGIAGLTLAILLYNADIPFHIFERAREIKPLGSFISLGPLTSALFKQLGIYDEFIMLGKQVQEARVYTEDLKHAFTMEFKWLEDVTGYKQHIVSRLALYELLLRQIPPENVNLGKRILNFWQNENGAVIRCSDKSYYHGDIIVGADGAYSSVRRRLYESLKEKKKLPACDDYLNKDTYKDNDTFRTTEWGPESAEAFAREVREFKLPGLCNGQPRTLGDYVDRTPPEFMSKVMLEEIVFQTWYGGRAMNPSGAVGASHAMLDAVTLANWISTLRKPTLEQLDVIFKEYRNERYPVVKEVFLTSQIFRRTMGKVRTIIE
ncbi:hypothetical protein BGZ94_005316 [Podila epigama]|nr:hypothetical protein BGZ94_005316 [Podila epigama]